MLLNLDITTFKTSSYRNQPYRNDGDGMKMEKSDDKKVSFSQTLNEEISQNTSIPDFQTEVQNIQDWDNVFKSFQNLNKSVNIKSYKNYMAQTSYGNLKVL